MLGPVCLIWHGLPPDWQTTGLKLCDYVLIREGDVPDTTCNWLIREVAAMRSLWRGIRASQNAADRSGEEGAGERR